MDENKKQRAYQLGMEAQQTGSMRVPALDSKLLKECISGNDLGESLPYLYEWLRGYDEALRQYFVGFRVEVTCRCQD